MVKPELLKILVCPRCKGELNLEEIDQKLICQKCRLKFPIKSDIPVMLLDQAERF